MQALATAYLSLDTDAVIYNALATTWNAHFPIVAGVLFVFAWIGVESILPNRARPTQACRAHRKRRGVRRAVRAVHPADRLRRGARRKLNAKGYV